MFVTDLLVRSNNGAFEVYKCHECNLTLLPVWDPLGMLVDLRLLLDVMRGDHCLCVEVG